ncbi:MAG: hypothetical protein LBE02_03785 [Spirochaetaceae bacterium]|jgi:hypothetical protein|nr:hypothetical protein [Spirochaetaceae bacterium]
MELKIIVFLAAFFLFLPIIRPLVRGLWALKGLTVCPLLAVVILLGIFPAYGFRPECLPLLCFALFFTAANFSDLLALFSGLQSDSYRDRGLIFIFASALGFMLALWLTLYFAPPMESSFNTRGVEVLTVQDTEDRPLYVRIYGPVEDPESGLIPEFPAPRNRPLLILLPPAAGSLYVTDTVCGALRDRGFTVLTYSRPGFDSPAVDGNNEAVRLSIPGLYRLMNALSRGLSDVAANADGRDLEEGRRRDIQFLMKELDRNKNLQVKLSSAGDAVFLAGYGAAGAALTVLAGQSDFIETYGQIRGIIALEGPILTSLAGDPPPPPPPPPANPAGAFFRHGGNFIRGFVPRKITRIENIPQPKLPILFILSGKVIQNRSGRYETILRTLGASKDLALLAAAPWAGPFDYSGSPEYYPIYSVLFRGIGHSAGSLQAGPELTASLISNFAALLLDQTGESPGTGESRRTGESPGTGEIPIGDAVEEGREGPGSLKTTPLDKSIYLETGGVWHIPGGRTILKP